MQAKAQGLQRKSAVQCVPKKTLVFEIQIGHIALNSSDKYNCFESFSERWLISFVNKTCFCHLSLTQRILEQSDHFIVTNLNFKD